MLRKRLVALTLATVLAASNAGSITAYASSAETESGLTSVAEDEQRISTENVADEKQTDLVEQESEDDSEMTEEASAEESDELHDDGSSEETSDLLDDDTESEAVNDTLLEDVTALDTEEAENEEFDEEGFSDLYSSLKLLSLEEDSERPRYSENEQARVSSFTMSWSGGQTIDLLKNSALCSEGSLMVAADISNYDGTKPLQFDITVDNSSCLDYVRVIGSISGKDYEITATRSGNTNHFTGSGYFIKGDDCDGLSRIRLKLVSNKQVKRIDKDPSAIEVDEELVKRFEIYKGFFPDMITTTTTNGTVHYTADYTELIAKTIGKDLESILEFEIGEASGPISSEMDLAKAIYNNLGYVVQGKDDENYIISFDTKKDGEFIAYIKDMGDLTNKAMQFKVKCNAEVYGSRPGKFEAFAEDFDRSMKVYGVCTEINKAAKQKEELYKEIEESTTINREAAKKTADDLYNDQVAFQVLSKMVIPLIIAAGGGVPAGAAAVYTALMATIDVAADYMWEYRANNVIGGEVSVAKTSVTVNGDFVHIISPCTHYDEETNTTTVLCTYEIYGHKSTGLRLTLSGDVDRFVLEGNLPYYDEEHPGISYSQIAPYITEIYFDHTVKHASFSFGSNHKEYAQNVTKITLGCYAETLGEFSDYTNLKEITIPFRIKEIPYRAFYNCGFEKVKFESGSQCKKIGELAFLNCDNLKEIDIPASVTEIGSGAFSQCYALKKITIRGDLEKLENILPHDSTFGNCNLEEIRFCGRIGSVSKDFNTCNYKNPVRKIYLLGTIQSVESGNYDYIFDAIDVYFYGDRQKWESLFSKHLFADRNRNGEYYSIHFGYKDGVETAVDEGLCGDNLTYRIIDPGMKSGNDHDYDLIITGSGPMYDYSSKNDVPWGKYKLRLITISDEVTKIGSYAFYGQKPVKDSVVISPAVTEIGDYAFCNSTCDKKILVIPDNVKKLGKGAFKGYSSTKGAIYLYISKGIEEIPNECFSDITVSGNVVIPENVRTIGDSAFWYANADDTAGAVFDIRGEVETIGSSAFFVGVWSDGRYRDTPINFKDNSFIRYAKSIGHGAFENSLISGEIEFGPEIKEIDSSAFKGCKNITGVKFGNQITNINNSAFEGCTGLTGTLELPGALKYIGSRAFYGCTGLSGDLIIPDSVRNVSTEAFRGCTGFDGKLVLPVSANSDVRIGEAAFSECSGFTGELVLNYPALSFHAYYEEGFKYNRTFYGMTGLDHVLIKNPDKKEDFADYFVKSGTTGEVIIGAGSNVEVGDISTFSSGTKIYCEEENDYNKIKTLGYDVTLVEKEKTYKITYNYGEGRPSYTFKDKTVIPNDLPNRAYDGYTFEGWYTSADFVEKAVPGTRLTQDTTIYAKYIANTYTVTFDAGKGKLADGAASTKAVTFGQPYGELPVATSDDEDETFIGWFTAEVDGVQVETDSAVATASDHTLYAVYKAVGKLTAPYVTDADGNRYESGKELQAGTRLYLRSADRNVAIYYVASDAAVKEIPEDDAHLYTGAINFTETTTISVKAVKENYKSSNIEAYTFMLKDSKKDFGELVDADREALLKDNKNADDIPAGLWAAGYDEEVDYTGSAITFDDTLHVYYGKKLLKSGDDYTVKYANNLKAYNGKTKATITITGKGNYTGGKKIEFVVKPLKLYDGNGKNSANLKIADVHVQYTGKVIKPTTTITYVTDDGKDVVLKKGTDFTYDYSEVGAEVSKDGYAVKVVGKGNYTGTATFTEYVFKQDEKINISKMTFKAIPAETADGTEKKPDVIITDKTSSPEYKQTPYELVKDKDFTVEYFNNKAAGTATAVVTGLDKYAGTKTLTFKINGIAISKAKFDIKAVTYNGAAQAPSYTLTYQASKTAAVETLTDKGENPDFTVSISNNIKKGTGTITFTGVGRFTGTAKKTFKINGLAINEGAVTVTCRDKSSSAATADLGTFNYTKGGVKPELTLTFNGEEMVLNRDYKVKYANNNAVVGAKKPVLTITGAGNFAGTLTRTFTITGASLADTTVTATDILVSTKAGTCKPVIAVYDTNGAKLAAGKDYDSKNIVYAYVSETAIQRKQGKKFEAYKAAAGEKVDVKNDIIPVGTEIKVTLYGAGLYDKNTSNEAVFTYVDNLISKATVKLNNSAYEYTGSCIELGESDLKVTIGKEVVPTGAYRITSITQNTQKGTAKLTIEGVGKFNGKYYGGSKTVTFKINARKIN